MAGLTAEERWMWVRQNRVMHQRVMHQRDQREMTAKLAEAIIKLEAEEVSPDIAV